MSLADVALPGHVPRLLWTASGPGGPHGPHAVSHVAKGGPDSGRGAAVTLPVKAGVTHVPERLVRSAGAAVLCPALTPRHHL